MSKTIRPVEILRSYVRNGSFPIDSTTVFYSYEEAVDRFDIILKKFKVSQIS